MQEAGEPLKLIYVEGPYGPYTEQLRHVLNRIEGHLVTGCADGGDSPHQQLELVPGAVDGATAFLTNHPETIKRINRVSDLVERFETPFGLELLATVYWVAKHKSALSLQEIISQTHAWNERKKQFSERQIRLAAKVLNQQGWLTEIEPQV